MPPRVKKEEKELLLIKKEWEAARIVYEEALQEIQDALEEVPQDKKEWEAAKIVYEEALQEIQDALEGVPQDKEWEAAKIVYEEALQDALEVVRQDKVKIQVMLASFQDDISDYMVIYQKINIALLNAPSRQVEHQESVKDSAKVIREATRRMTAAKLLFEPDENTASLRSTASDSGDSRSRRKLPKLNLPRFSVKNRDGLPFWSLFKEIHEDAAIPVMGRFHCFIRCMEEGSLAKTIVLSYPVMSDNYHQPAVDDVRDRWEDNVLMEVCVRDLIGLVVENAAQKHPIVECCITADVLRAYQRVKGSHDGINEDSEDELRSLMAFLKREVVGEDNLQLAGEGLSKSDNVVEVKKWDWKNIEDSAPGREIKWNFIPPAASWWVGWWERMVGVVKNVLRRVMGQSVWNQHERITVLTDVEAVVNQRPHPYVSENPDDLKPLTPSMFLMGGKDIHLSKSEHAGGVGLNERLRYMQRMREDIRACFKNEYLGQLMNMKHQAISRKLRVGDVVLVEQDNCKRVMWPIGKITEVFPGKDGVVRVVKVQTANGEVTRSIQRIYQFGGCWERKCEAVGKFQSSWNTAKLFGHLLGG